MNVQTDAWMDKIINGTGNRQQDKVDKESYAELELFFLFHGVSVLT